MCICLSWNQTQITTNHKHFINTCYIWKSHTVSKKIMKSWGALLKPYFIESLTKVFVKIEGSIQLNNDLYWSGDFEQIKFLLNSNLIKEEDIQFYLGYSGWGVGQLRAELDKQSWFVRRKATANEIFDMESDILWKSILKHIVKCWGRFFLIM